jgi:sugar lactone lactonase YvrE
MNYEIECALAVKNQLGEGPLWHHQEQALYWVDIGACQVHRFSTTTGQHAVFTFDLPVTALGMKQSGGFVVATRDGFATWSPPDPKLTFITDPEANRPGARFNDGAVDPVGHFWAGTMKAGEATSSLYRFDPDEGVQQMLSGLTISNGIGWSPDCRKMYVTDSLIHTIYAFDFEPSTGTIDNQRVFAHTPHEPGVPDGLAVDSEGFVWSVRCRGWKITRYAPTGKTDLEISLPVECPTSCAFGGNDLDELYITTSRSLVASEQLDKQPLAGTLLRIPIGIRGQKPSVFLG